MTIEDVSSLVGTFYDGLLGHCSARVPLDLLKERLRASRTMVLVRPGSAKGDSLVMCSDDPGVPGKASVAPDAAGFEEAAGRHVTGADAWLEDGAVCSLRAFRQSSEPPFGKQEHELCVTLVPHVQRALGIRRRLDSSESERRLYSGVMDRLMVGAMILDLNAQLVRATPMAQALLAAEDGIRLIARRPHAASSAQDRELQKMIRAAVGHGSGEPALSGPAISISRPSGLRDLGLVVQAFTTGDRYSPKARPAAAIFIRDPERNVEVANNILRQLFDLTPAEAEVARRLAEGFSLAEAARALNIRRNTARAHLRSIFSKSGITRQPELVRILLNSAAVLGVGRDVAVH
ncbi:MAG: helix-turn-helix transcriptional regulator [Proteobacteria bacterium]|nr:helix-turn-helix transcriptional regulator [Pseudomonadota bacterium]